MRVVAIFVCRQNFLRKNSVAIYVRVVFFVNWQNSYTSLCPVSFFCSQQTQKHSTFSDPKAHLIIKKIQYHYAIIVLHT